MGADRDKHSSGLDTLQSDCVCGHFYYRVHVLFGRLGIFFEQKYKELHKFVSTEIHEF